MTSSIVVKDIHAASVSKLINLGILEKVIKVTSLAVDAVIKNEIDNDTQLRDIKIYDIDLDIGDKAVDFIIKELKALGYTNISFLEVGFNNRCNLYFSY